MHDKLNMCHGASLQIIFNSLIFIFPSSPKRDSERVSCPHKRKYMEIFFPLPSPPPWASFYFRLVAVGLFLKILFCAIPKRLHVLD